MSQCVALESRPLPQADRHPLGDEWRRAASTLATAVVLIQNGTTCHPWPRVVAGCAGRLGNEFDRDV